MGAFLRPAAATDNWSALGYPAIQEGARLRFAADTDCQRGDTSLFWKRARAICATMRKYGLYIADQTGGGFAYMNMTPGHGGWTGDGGNAYQGTHWPSEYFDVFADVWASKLQVLAEPSPWQEWTPTCGC
jgi:hypothetical protein